jgi:hypothetical protein
MGARHEGCLSLGRAASPHPESAAKAAYLSFRHSGFYDESSPLAHMLAQPPAAGGGFPGSRSSSPWPALPGGFGRSAAEAAAHVQKYPSYLEVTLAAVPRPPAAVVVTDPAAGMRPVLPAGFGSGYEIGERLARETMRQRNAAASLARWRRHTQSRWTLDPRPMCH